MRTVLCNLWHGVGLPKFSQGAYGLKDVLGLWRGVRRHIKNSRLVVLCDEQYYSQLISLRDETTLLNATLEPVKYEGYGVGGWTNIMESMRTDVFERFVTADGEQRALLVGLDTVIVGNCDWLFKWNKCPIGIPADPFNIHIPCNAVVSFDHKGSRLAWEHFLEVREQEPFPHLYGGKASEMTLLRYLYKIHGWEMLEGETKQGKLLSYKGAGLAKKEGIPPETSIVYFHGLPKINDLSSNDPVHIEWEKE